MHHGIPTMHFCDSQQRGSTINSELIDNQHCWLLIRGRSTVLIIDLPLINSWLLIIDLPLINSWLLIVDPPLVNDRQLTVDCWSAPDQQLTVDHWSAPDQQLTVDCQSAPDQQLTVDCQSPPPPTVRWSTLSEQKLVSILVGLASQRTFPLGKSQSEAVVKIPTHKKHQGFTATSF